MLFNGSGDNDVKCFNGYVAKKKKERDNLNIVSNMKIYLVLAPTLLMGKVLDVTHVCMLYHSVYYLEMLILFKEGRPY